MDLLAREQMPSMRAHLKKGLDVQLSAVSTEAGTEIDMLEFDLSSDLHGDEASECCESTGAFEEDPFDTGDDNLHIPASLRAPDRSCHSSPDVWGPKGLPGCQSAILNERPACSNGLNASLDAWDILAEAANSYAHSKWQLAIEVGRSLVVGTQRRNGRSFSRCCILESEQSSLQDIVFFEEKRIFEGDSNTFEFFVEI